MKYVKNNIIIEIMEIYYDNYNKVVCVKRIFKLYYSPKISRENNTVERRRPNAMFIFPLHCNSHITAYIAAISILN